LAQPIIIDELSTTVFDLARLVTSGFVADISTDTLHSFLRGTRAEIDTALRIE